MSRPDHNTVWRVTHIDGSRTVYGAYGLALASARADKSRIEEIELTLRPGPLLRELEVAQQLSSSRGSDDAIDEAKIDLVRLQRIEDAAVLAYGWLWHATTNDPMVHTARKALRDQLDRDDMRRGIQMGATIGILGGGSQHVECADERNRQLIDIQAEPDVGVV